MLKYPGATWEPLGPQTQRAMTAHDVLCFHTMVGSLAGTSSMFHRDGYGGTESHLGVGEHGETEQWQDGMYAADANLEGWGRVFSIETADYGGGFGKWNTNNADNVPSWTAAQLDRLVDITVWFCRPETHSRCPSTWRCRREGVPCVLIPDTKRGRRGIGYHRQGCDPWRVDGGERWSKAYGKGCPGPKRIEQLIEIVIPRAQRLLAGGVDNEEDDLNAQEKAQLDRIEQGVASLAKAEAGRYSDIRRLVQTFSNQEGGRYQDFVRRFNAILADLAADPNNPVTDEDARQFREMVDAIERIEAAVAAPAEA
jgi:hypothetical protein